MSQELISEQRLTQIEKLLESAVKLSHSNTARIDALTAKVEHNTESIDALTKKVEHNTESIDALGEKVDRVTDRVDRVTEQLGRATEIFIDSMNVMREMQSEIRGLQVENRRILDRLFGEENPE
jgi:chromosome segregation ATPase